MHNFVNLVLRDSLAGSPFVPIKQDPFSLGAAAIMGGASFLGSMLGFGSQSDTNAQQVALTREQMAHQSQENQLNRDWSEKMWNAQNQYNTPSAMMARYQQAGLNPYLVGSDSGVGSAGSPVSPSMVGQGSVPSLTAPKLDFNSPSSMVLQALNVDANVSNQESQVLNNVLDAAKKAWDINGVDGAQQVLDMYLPLVGNVGKSPIVQQFKVEQAQRELELDLFDFRSQIEQRFGYQKAERSMEILQRESDKIWKEIDKLDSDILYNQKAMDELLSRMAENYARAANLDADTQTINESRRAIVSMLTYQSDMAYYEQQENEAEFSSNRGVRLFKHLPEAQRKRLEAETTMNPLWNKRVAAVSRFRDAIGLNTSVGLHGVTGSYSSNINHVPHNSKTASWKVNDRGHVVNWSETHY